jgi:hypothetical protein
MLLIIAIIFLQSFLVPTLQHLGMMFSPETVQF